jgi:DNA polymerase-3 subunit beta
MKLEASGTNLKVLGCDGEIWVEREIACTVNTPGSVLVNAKLIQELVDSLPDGSVHLDWNGRQLTVDETGSRYELIGQEAGDFPAVPEVAGQSSISLPMGKFKSLVDSVLFAVATDIHRQILTGVQFTYKDDELRLVATDTHRLAVQKMNQDGIGSEMSLVLPEKAIRAIKNVPVVESEKIELQFSNLQMFLNLSGVRIVSQILDGQYPNWERVVPAETTRTWDIPKDELESKLRRCMIIARDVSNRVRFSCKGDMIHLSARGDQGEAKESLPCIATNGDVDVAFNARYVLDALAPIESDTVQVKLSESSRPAIFRSAAEDEQYFCVIMPMALTA